MAYVIMREEKDTVRCLTEANSTMCKLFDTKEEAELMKKQLIAETAVNIHWFIVEM
ncbi:hypothetical protein SFC66_06285 [Terribacillus saccharophilus]|uniref:hypothetical protein n=1 Tax=Terribacillus saccharophilus TaxID=361277 RepID=UPI0039822A87